MIERGNFSPRIYTAVMPNCGIKGRVFPEKRQREIDGVNNAKVKEQKFWVWKLLEVAIERALGEKISRFEFEKLGSGKWISPSFYFSLSHSDDMLAVGISSSPIGVDIEKIHSVNLKAIEKTLTEREKQDYSLVLEEKKEEYLISAWTKKESAFKMSNEQKFLPSKIDGGKDCVLSERLERGEKKYILSVSSALKNNVKNIEWIRLDD